MPNALLVTAALLTLADLVCAAPEVIIDTDFGAAGKAFEIVDEQKGNRIVGSLPEGWGENSGWKEKVVAEYRPTTEDGRTFLRIVQTSGDGLQFMYSLPGIEKGGGYYRLTLTARGRTGCSLGLRFNGPPYTSPWTASPATVDEWRDFSYDFRLSEQPQPLGLYCYLPANGSLDLQSLKLVRLSDEDLIAEVKAKYPEGGQGNLLRTTRFPLGLQSGWSIAREYSDGDQVQVHADGQVSGPSGCPALRVNAPLGITVYGEPFLIPWSFEQHVASVYVRGSWDGRVVAIGGQVEYCGECPIKVDATEWQRVQFAFKPILLARSHSLMIEGKGTLWLDSLQVERGTEASPFAPRAAAEVSLALPESDASSARVQFEGEPMQAQYCVVGAPRGALLRARLVTIYGDEIPLPPVALDGGPLSTGTLTYAPAPEHPFGPYRLEAWVEDAGGKRISAESEVVFYRLRRPRHWGEDAPDSFFGTHTLSTTRHLTMAKAVGCNWVRLHDSGTEYIGWSFLEPEKGDWRFRDADLQRYRDHHLKILGLLSTSPGWASNWGKPCTGYFERYMEPLKMDDWANAVRTIVDHHRGLIDTYEVWNEPWGSAFWSLTFDEKHGLAWQEHFIPSETAPQDYARLQATAYAAAHEVMPDVSILGFNTYISPEGAKWTRGVLDAGGLDTCDAISYHHYESALTGMPDDAVAKGYATAMEPIIEQQGQVPKPVWMSEGAPLSGDTSNGFYRCTLPYENAEDNWRLADRLARYLISRHSTGEKHAFLYTMHGHSTFGGRMDWSTLITADGYLHPTAAAHSACAWLLEDTQFARVVTLADGVFAYLFEGPDRAVAAITTSAAHAAYALPQSDAVQCYDLFGNPVPAGAAIDDHAHYVTTDEGLAALEAALGAR